MQTNVLVALVALAIGASGRGVANLHSILARLGLAVDIPPEEIVAEQLGSGTMRALRRLLDDFGIDGDEEGISAGAARRINETLAERGLLVELSGTMSGADRGRAGGAVLRVHDERNLHGQAAAETRTDDDGHYRTWIDPNFYSFARPGVIETTASFVVVVRAFDEADTEIGRSKPIASPGSPRLVIDFTSSTSASALARMTGVVRDVEGYELQDVEVSLLQRGFAGTSIPLGKTARTDANGRFAIAYRLDRAQADTLAAAVIVVLGLHSAGRRVVITALTREPVEDEPAITVSLPVPAEELKSGFIPRRNEAVTIMVGGRAGTRKISEFEELMEDLRPLLGEKSPADLDEVRFGDITLAAQAIGEDRERIADLATAFRLQRDNFPDVDPASLYALARRGFHDVPSLAAASAEEMVRAIADAEGHLIPKRKGDHRTRTAALRLTVSRVSSGLVMPERFGTLHDILARSVPDAARREALIKSLAQRSRRAAPMHTAVDVPPARIELTLALGRMSGNNAPLIGAIEDAHKDADSLRVLAFELDPEIIAEHIDRTGAPIPQPRRGETPEAAKRRYATQIAAALHAAHPTAAIARKSQAWAASVPDVVRPATAKLLETIVRRTDYELGNGGIATIAETRGGELLQDISDPAERNVAVAEARRIDRLVALSRRPEHVELLVTHKTARGPIDGAFDIARFSREAFIAGFANVSPEIANTLGDLHDRASSMADASGALLLGLDQAAFDVLPAAISRSVNVARMPDWTKVFGSGRMCECEECRSLWGAPAYLVNVLEFLDKRCKVNASGMTPLDVLIGNPAKQIKGRRADLANIKLSCANSSRTLPTIDLINEILEATVVFASAVVDQTPEDATSDELAAAPENINGTAYEILLQAIQHISLPYDRVVSTTRAYLAQVGVKIGEVARLFGSDGNREAAARLGLLEKDWGILTGKNFAGGPGMSSRTRALFGIDDLPGDDDSEDSWNVEITPARFAAKALDLTLAELIEITNTVMVSGPWTPAAALFRKRIPLGANTMAQLRANNFNNPAPDVLNALAFVGISLADLKTWSTANASAIARTIVVDPPADVDFDEMRIIHLDGSLIAAEPDEQRDDGWLRLHRFARLRRRMQISTEELDLALIAVSPSQLWAPVTLTELAALKGLKERLGLDWRVAASLLALIDTRDAQSLYARLFLRSGVAKLDPIFLMRPGELVLPAPGPPLAEHVIPLAAALGCSTADVEAIARGKGISNVTLENVSILHRHVVIARALGLSGFDYERLQTLSRLGPFGFLQNVGLTSSFLDMAQTWLKGPSLADIAYFMGETPTGPSSKSGQELDAILKTVCGAVEKLASRPAPAASTEGIAAQEESLLAQRRTIVRQTLASAFAVDPEIVALLLDSEHFAHQPGSGELAPFLALAADAEDAHARSLATTLIAGLDRVMVPIRGLKISAAELIDMLPSNLFLQFAEPHDHSFSNLWHDLANRTAARDSFGGDLAKLDAARTAIAAPASPTSQETIAAAAADLLGGPIEHVRNILAALLAANPDIRGQPFVLLGKIRDRLELCRKTLSSPETLTDIVGPAGPARSKALENLINGIQARYDPASWLGLSRQINDPLREERRDALVEYALWSRELESANELFEMLLVDTGINAFLQTSRIAHAIATVQIFVQRCRLGFEATNGDARLRILPDQISTEWESTLHDFRMWQANMEVLARPEWFMEAELRDDKTPGFRDLISFLRQNDPTPDNLNQALSAYLEKLSEVANLEVCGTYLQEDFAGDESFRLKSALHVFGRSRGGLQKRYYYRRLNTYANFSEWTPWELVKLDIQGVERDPQSPRGRGKQIPGVHLLPLVWRRRLYVFWPSFVRKTDAPSQAPRFDMRTGQSNATPPNEYWEVKLCWSRYENGAWTAKEQSADFYQTTRPTDAGGEELYLPDPPTLWLLSGRSRERQGVEDLRIHLFGSTPAPRYLSTFYVDRYRGDMIVTPLNRWGNTIWKPFFIDVRAEYMLRVGEETLKCLAYSDEYSELHNAQGNDWSFELFSDAPPFKVVQPSQETGQQLLVPYVLTDAISSYCAYVDEAQIVVPNFEDHVELVEDFTTGGKVEVHTWEFSENVEVTVPRSSFVPFYHPFVDHFATTVSRYGFERLFEQDMQRLTLSGDARFSERYGANEDGLVITDEGVFEGIDFGAGTPYGVYNNELFLHFHLLLADMLIQNRQFKAATDALRRIFDPLGKEENVANAWKFVPFTFGAAPSFEELVAALAKPPGDPMRRNFLAQIEASRLYPFQPFRIARMRPDALKRHAFIKSVNAWLKWGEDHHRRYTPESLAQAFQLYLVCDALLGTKPDVLPARSPMPAKSYAELRPKLDELGDVLLTIEEQLSALGGLAPPSGSGTGHSALLRTASLGYFCVPPDRRLLDLWDSVADRLLKLRNGMTLDGVRRQPQLFGEPVDPAALVKAAVAGQDLQAAVDAAIGTDRPHHRFTVRLRLARDLVDQVITITAALTTTLEKRDAEALAMMRAVHESDMLAFAATVNQLMVDEAEQNIVALHAQRAAAVVAWDHARTMLDAGDLAPPQTAPDGTVTSDGRMAAKRLLKFVENTTLDVPISFDPSVGISLTPTHAKVETGKVLQEESEEVLRSFEATMATATASQLEALGGILSLIPNFEGSAKPLGLGAAVHFGGTFLGGSLAAIARCMNAGAVALGFMATSAARKVGFIQRERDLVEKLNSAAAQALHIDQLTIAAMKRKAVLIEEQTNHARQLQRARSVEDFLRTKVTTTDFYIRTESRLVELQTEVWTMALDAVEQARSAYRFELQSDPPDLPPNLWDPKLRGLLAGEPLKLALTQLETAFLQNSRQELELTRHFSLRQINPFALAELRETCTCNFNLPEALFDLDNPGHYFRRIHSVALSLPCIVGPYAAVSATLRQESSNYRKVVDTSATANGYPQNGESDPRFKAIRLPTEQVIVTSSGREDSGRFERTPGDDAYRPFEGTGAVSSWKLSLPKSFRQFDYRTISDVIIHLRYTARDGGETVASVASESLQSQLSAMVKSGPMFTLFSLRHEFADDWARFVNDPAGAQLSILITRDHIPYLLRPSAKLTHAGSQSVWVPERGEANFNDNPEIGVSGPDMGPWRVTLQRPSDERTYVDAYFFAKFSF